MIEGVVVEGLVGMENMFERTEPVSMVLNFEKVRYINDWGCVLPGTPSHITLQNHQGKMILS